MINIKGNLWNEVGVADCICITTNSYIKNNGLAVMGRGCALEATKHYPNIQRKLASVIKLNGNMPAKLLTDGKTEIWSFPVKHNWWEEADIELIKQSAMLMVNAANAHREWNKIVIPRPGCGNGKLSYSDVECVLKPILNDRFYIITF